MITTLEYTKDKVVKGNLDKLKSPKTFVWVDVFQPTRKEIDQIQKITGIPQEDISIALEEDQRPKVIDIEGPFSLIIFGAPSFEKDETTTTPVFIYISKSHNSVITIRGKDTKSISRMKESVEAKKNFFDKGSSYFVYRLLDEILNTYFGVLDDIENQIDKIEDCVVKTPDIKIVERIFETKKTLIYFVKTMSANREVISSIEKEYLSEIDKKRAKQFRTLYNDTVQLVDMSGTYRDILTGTLDTYLSSVSNNLNKIMKTLTVGASFILIPTLIASIYGMNFQLMPELHWKYGYFFSLGLMAFSILFTWVFFKVKGWI
jgi:magnesium transporter